MNDEKFQEFLDQCFDDLEKKQQSLIENYGMGSYDNFNYDFEKEEIYFLREGQIKVKAKIIPIGSFNAISKTWMWAWANDAFPEALRKKSSQLKELEEITGFEMFGNEMAEIEEDMAWEITGMAVNLFKFQGAYRGPANDTIYFYAMNDVANISS